MGPVDVIFLTHNRFEHLVSTLDALRERTPEPIRITVVDNASAPEIRNWLADHRDLFERIIPRASDEHVPAFQHGIEATTSDPFIISDPDLVVPDLDPSWLARMLEMLERHPDFGLIGVDLERSNFPDFLTEELVDVFRGGDGREVLDGGDLIEANVGTHFALIRRDALLTPFVTDIEACRSIRERGYLTGVATTVKALHLGFDDPDRYPEYLRVKDERGAFYPSYKQSLEKVDAPPPLEALALAGPLLALTRGAGIPDRAVAELAWQAPFVGEAAPGVRTLWQPPLPLPLAQGAARAVVLADPPRESLPELLDDACRVATEMVVLLSTLEAVGGELGDELAPAGWDGREQRAVGDVPLRLAEQADRQPELRERLGLGAIENRDEWLAFFAAGAFGTAERRLFVFEATAPGSTPERVIADRDALVRYAPPPPRGLDQPLSPDPDGSLPEASAGGLRSGLRRLAARLRRPSHSQTVATADRRQRKGSTGAR